MLAPARLEDQAPGANAFPAVLSIVDSKSKTLDGLHRKSRSEVVGRVTAAAALDMPAMSVPSKPVEDIRKSRRFISNLAISAGWRKD